MKNKIFVSIFLTLGLSVSTLNASEDMKAKAVRIAKAGGVAAGLKVLAEKEIEAAQIKAKFVSLGDDVVKAALKWSKDVELRESVPAFRRFLLMDYLTGGGDIIVAATNPDNLLINTDAAINAIFEDKGLIDAATKIVESSETNAVHQTVGKYFLSAIPMKPTGAKAQSCIACHKAPDVAKPYPEGKTVLGWTLIAQPIK